MTNKTFDQVMKATQEGKYEVTYWMAVRGSNATVEVQRPNGKRKFFSVSNVPQLFVDQHNGK